MIATSPNTVDAPEELVAKLSREAKGTVLALLLRELIDLNGGRSLISIVDAEGEPLGHFVPPEAEKAQFEAAIKEMPESVRERILRRLPDNFDIDDCLSDADLESIRKEAYRKSQ